MKQSNIFTKWLIWDLLSDIGFAAVLASATQTLIGLGPLMDQGYEVHFAKTGVGIFLHNKLIYKGFYDSQRKLFQISIVDLIVPIVPSTSASNS